MDRNTISRHTFIYTYFTHTWVKKWYFLLWSLLLLPVSYTLYMRTSKNKYIFCLLILYYIFIVD